MFSGLGCLRRRCRFDYFAIGQINWHAFIPLAHSPFTNFFIPGIILFLVLVLVPCLLVPALLRKRPNKYLEYLNAFKDMHWLWTFTIYTAFALIIWIQVETMFIQGTGWLQTFYMLYSIPLIFTALLPGLRAGYKKQESLSAPHPA